ncbi:MAG: PadR family transcriptional regulator [Candidatus Nanoarchaeia archaeon]|nr:PadR family transcriptional regulator [Candidatus Nanoarchaeia archaeon]
MKLLEEKERHGYEIMDELGKKIGWKPSTGAVYPKLQELELNELIKSEEVKENGKIKKVYRLTEKGKAEVKQIKDKKKEIKGTINHWLDSFTEMTAYFWPDKELDSLRLELDNLKNKAVNVSKKHMDKAIEILKKAQDSMDKL